MQALIEALRSDGWCCRSDFIDSATVAALRADLAQRRVEFSAAAVGRAQQRRHESTIRADATLWLTGDSAAQRTFFVSMEALRLALNRHLYLGLHDYEAHYAYYATGAFYRRHLDTLQGDARAPRRVVSTVCYLNEDWQAGAGGELVLSDRDEREITRIIPRAGTAVFFLSDEFPHEVKPAMADRYSIAGWFRSQGRA